MLCCYPNPNVARNKNKYEETIFQHNFFSIETIRNQSRKLSKSIKQKVIEDVAQEIEK